MKCHPKAFCGPYSRSLQDTTAATSSSAWLMILLAPTWVFERRQLQAQIESIKDQGDLRVEFYGRGRLADWLREHPSVQLWVREKLGLSLSGWKSSGDGGSTPPDAEDDLICKEGIAISLPERVNKLGIVQGIEEIQRTYKKLEKAVRIVGLSGVGKSRIVQALFEETVGDEPLDGYLAIYADLGEEPSRLRETSLDVLLWKDVRRLSCWITVRLVPTERLLA